MIPFNKPTKVENHLKYLNTAIENGRIEGDGPYTKKCSEWLSNQTKSQKVLLTTSCTHALEMSALLLNIKEGDEIIMPSYTFVSTANAFVLRGAKIVFVDIRKDTMNIDENKIEKAITKRTKAIVPVHYAGVCCEMDEILRIARRYNLTVIEDAAQGMMSTYKKKALGTIGDIGCYSFHATKNYTMGEGGALLINHDKYNEMAEIIREKGTDRSKFLLGQIDKYTWIEKGSSYLPSDINAAYLLPQLECAEKINHDRIQSWNYYYSELRGLEDRGFIELPHIPKECAHNGHMFYLKVADLTKRNRLMMYLREREIFASTHYVPLHLSFAGSRYGSGLEDNNLTSIESDRLLRLPMYYGLTKEEILTVTSSIQSFYNKEG